MTLHRLQLFLTIAESLNLTKVSQALRISQPAISLQLKALEREFNVSLFKKTGRGLALTAEGRRLWKDLQPILNQLERLELKYRHKAETTAQEILAIGGSPGLSTVLLPSLVARFKEDHPSITVFLHTATSEEIQELVLNGKIELALVVNPFPSLGLHIEPYRREQLVPFVSPKHPLTKQQGLPLKELVKFPLAVRMGRSRENRAAAYLARIQGGVFEANNLVCCDSSQAVKTIVRKGAAVGIAYKEVIERDIKQGQFRALRLKTCNLTVQSYLIYSNQSAMSAGALAFRELLQKHRPHGRVAENQ